MLTILQGQVALQALSTLQSNPARPVAVAMSATTRAGGPCDLLAFATTDKAIVIDVIHTPDLKMVWQTNTIWAAYDAKVVHKALLRQIGAAPSRWACILISAILLAAGNPVSLELAAIAQALASKSPPEPDLGIAALAEHAKCLANIIEQQSLALQQAHMQHVSKIEARAVAPIAAMEHHGVPFDAAGWKTLAQSAQQTQRQLETELLNQLFANQPPRNLFKETVGDLTHDPNLLKALQQAGHRLTDIKKRSVAQLQEPLKSLVERFRSTCKLTSSYGMAFLEHVSAQGRIHPTFVQIGASTGRMACHAPNLQAMVKKPAYRACFRASPGKCLVIADYATCELRILAEMSQDPVFLRAFSQGEDLHATVASSLFGKLVSKNQHANLRHLAKTVNFGLAYGMGATGLARTLNIAENKAQELLTCYFEKFPRIRQFLTDTANAALKQGFAQTLSGRRLSLNTQIYTQNRALALRVAKNMPIQGTNADIIKIALAALHQRLQAFSQTWIVHCVHDEIMVECPINQAQAVEACMIDSMCQAGNKLLQHVTMAVDSQISQSWGGPPLSQLTPSRQNASLTTSALHAKA